MAAPSSPPSSPFAAPRTPNPGARREFKDARRAVTATKKAVDSPPLLALPDPVKTLPKHSSMPMGYSRMDLTPSSSSAGPTSPTYSFNATAEGLRGAMASTAARFCSSGCLDGVISRMHSCFTGRAPASGSRNLMYRQGSEANDKYEGEAKEAPRRWYRVHPITDELYYVRPDAGLAGRAEGHPDAGVLHSVSWDSMHEDSSESTGPVKSQLKRGLVRHNSLKPSIMRRQGLMDPGMNDTFANQCKLCYDKCADVVLLPCRHGGMCEECLRRSLFIRPPNRGGNSCPYCRKKIIEVIKMYDDSAINMYGYAISAGCFFLGKDDNA